MLFLSSRLRPALNRDESGIAIAEILTSAIIIVLILSANALALISAYTAYSTSESANKAYQIINKQFAYFRQAPFNQLGTTTQGNAVPKCDPLTSPFNGENVSLMPAASAFKYSGATAEIPFQLCQQIQYPSQAKPVVLYDVSGNQKVSSNGSTAPGGLGVKYTYQTVITNVSTNSFDSTSLPMQSDSSTAYNPKRITVTVKWDENDSSGTTKTQQVRLSTIRTPTVAECVPTGVRDSNGAVIARAGCGAS
jgi:hypothetical protein